MPKITDIKPFDKRISFPGDFLETYQNFLKIIRVDKTVRDQMTPVQKTSGLVSLGVRVAIDEYVKRRMPAYIRHAQEQIRKKQERQEATEE